MIYIRERRIFRMRMQDNGELTIETTSKLLRIRIDSTTYIHAYNNIYTVYEGELTMGTALNLLLIRID